MYTKIYDEVSNFHTLIRKTEFEESKGNKTTNLGFKEALCEKLSTFERVRDGGG